MGKKLTILTCVTNLNGSGPGHTAIAVDNTVYSFENTGDWFSFGGNNASGWITADLDAYLKKNAHRPVILQTLNEKVKPDPVLGFIRGSMASDDDYLSSGVCSSLVSSAINAGLTGGFNPSGVDTPWKVYNLARAKGIVADEQGVWPGAGSVTVLTWASIVNKLKADFPNAPVPVNR